MLLGVLTHASIRDSNVSGAVSLTAISLLKDMPVGYFSVILN